MPELSAAPSINDTRTQALLVLIARLATHGSGRTLPRDFRKITHRAI